MTKTQTINIDFLAQATIWLTRPYGQVDALQHELSRYRAKVLHIPMLEIEGVGRDGQWPESIKTSVLNLDQYQLVFFISTNAAKFALECIDYYWPQYPEQVLNFAVGPSTAKVLENYGLQVFYPDPEMNSETLLALPQLEHVNDSRALVFRGQGGREILAQGLRSKGVKVQYVELYCRKRPQYDQQVLKQHLKNDSPNAVVISSAEALENFTKVFEGCWPEYKQVPLYVSSKRIEELARSLGFETIFTMPGANDEAIMASLGNL